jgi:CDP-Glycerol:Poly(glycerophosphate) glycerophosphotransferase
MDFYASERHYLDHLAPLVRAFPGSRVLVTTDSLQTYAHAELGLEAVHAGKNEYPMPPMVVAGRRDAMRMEHPDRRVAMIEHGAGQTYLDQPHHSNYAGGRGLDFLRLVLAPGPHSARAWRARYPETPVVDLGGSPRLDKWYSGGVVDGCVDRPIDAPFVVAVSFHWDCRITTETRSTWRYWLRALRELSETHVMLGHAHPRAWPDLRAIYEQFGIPATPTFDDVLAQADLYACDNSSTLYEFAATDRPVICLNSPEYRREVEHGLRFWQHMPGIDISPDEPFGTAITAAHDEVFTARRRAALHEAYGGLPDGEATKRAVTAINEHLL